MGVATILMLAAAAEPAAAAPVLPRDWTLTPSPPPPAIPPSCREEAAAGAIVVCGQREDVLPAIPGNAAEFAPDEPYRMQFGLDGGGTVGPELEQAGMPDGRISKRILVRVRVPF